MLRSLFAVKARSLTSGEFGVWSCRAGAADQRYFGVKGRLVSPAGALKERQALRAAGSNPGWRAVLVTLSAAAFQGDSSTWFVSEEQLDNPGLLHAALKEMIFKGERGWCRHSSLFPGVAAGQGAEEGVCHTNKEVSPHRPSP